MPGYFLYYSGSFKESAFDAHEFLVRKGAKAEKQRIEGHKMIYYYYFDTSTGKPPASPLQIKRNYQNATLKVGGKVLYEEGINSAYNRKRGPNSKPAVARPTISPSSSGRRCSRTWSPTPKR